MALPFVPWSGPDDARVLCVGERPGYSEAVAYRKEGYDTPTPFIGASGLELFGGWDKYGERHVGHWTKWVKIPRREVRVGNLVPTFRHGDNPEPWEVEKWGPQVCKEINAVRPEVIVLFGLHASRYVLGHSLSMDLVNGLPTYWRGCHACSFHTSAPTDRCPSCGKKLFVATAVSVVHPAYALREPSQQDALAEGLQAVRKVLDGTLLPRLPLRQLDPERLYVAEFADMVAGKVIDADREGDVRAPECFTFAYGNYACLWECANRKGRRDIQRMLDSTARVNFHYAVADLKAAWHAGLTVPRVDDSMVMAFLLNDHQGLKDLAYRRLGVRIPSFEDVQGPVDEARVRETVLRWAVALRDDPARTATYEIPRVSEKTGKPLKPKTAPTPDAKALNKVFNSLVRLVDDPSDQRTRWTTSVVLGPARTPPPVVTWADLPTDVREPYALRDPYVTGLVRRQMQQEIRREGLGRLHRIDRNVIPMLARMEHIGMAVDPWALRTLRRELRREFAAVCRRIEREAGRRINPNASEEVSDLLFGELGVAPTKRTKGKGYYTTEDKYLEARKHEHPVIPLIIAARQLKKMEGVCTGIVDAAVWVEDGEYYVLYPNLTYTRVVSGRPSAKDPNVLAIPKHSMWGVRIRAAFFTRPRKVLLSHDLSQIELRTAADASKDPVLVAAYLHGEDLHAKTAHEILGAPRRKEDQDESLHRLPAKTTNFSILMGTTAYGLADSINEALAEAFERTHHRVGEPGRDFQRWTQDDTGKLIKEWYAVYAGVKVFQKDMLRFARRTGYVEDRWSRRRYSGGLHSSNRWIREAAEREVQSFPYQAGAQGLMKIWQARIWTEVIVPRQARGEYVEPWLSVHDDQLVECTPTNVDDVSREMTACLPQLLCVPVKDDAKQGQSWGELK